MHELPCQMLLELGFAMDEPKKINSTIAAWFLELRHSRGCLWRYLIEVVRVVRDYFMVLQNKSPFESHMDSISFNPLYFRHLIFYYYNSNKWRLHNVKINNIYNLLLIISASHTFFHFKVLMFSHCDVFEVDNAS